MLHQPTPRTDLAVWAEDTMNVIGMIEADAVIVSEPFLVAIPVLEERASRSSRSPTSWPPTRSTRWRPVRTIWR